MSNLSGTYSITKAGPVRATGLDHFIFRFSSSTTACHGFWQDTALVLPSALFIVYLGFHARSNLKKLNHRRSCIMIGYYGLLWFAALLNLAWCFLQLDPLRRAEGEEWLLKLGSLAIVIGWLAEGAWDD